MAAIEAAINSVVDQLRKSAKYKNALWRKTLYNTCRPFAPNFKDEELKKASFDTLTEASLFFADVDEAIYSSLIEWPGSHFFDNISIRTRPFYAGLANGKHATVLADEVWQPGDAQEIVKLERMRVYEHFRNNPK